MIPFPKSKLSTLMLLPLLADQSLALGLGDARITSYLGSPLVAEIPLLGTGGLNDDQIIVGLTRIADHSQGAVESSDFLNSLRFTHQLEGKRGMIRVSSSGALREPFVSFHMSVRWPSGNLLREYTLLPDPKVPAPSASVALIHPAGEKKAVQTKMPETTNGSPQHVTLESTVVTRPGDSLWRLAARIPRPSGSNIAQAMNALYQLNPQAFVDDNANRLRALTPIITPTAAQITAAPTQFAPTKTVVEEPLAAHKTSVSVSPGQSGAEASRSAALALPGSGGQEDPAREDMSEQMEGIKAGVGMVEAGKAQTRAHLAELEDQLNALVLRYEKMSARAGELERQARRDELATERTAQAAVTTATTTAMIPAQKSSHPTSTQFEKQGALQWLVAVIGGSGMLGYAIGQLAPPHSSQRKRRPGSPGNIVPQALLTMLRNKLLSRLHRQKTTGSTTYESPHLGHNHGGQCAENTAPAPVLSVGGDKSTTLRDLNETVIKHPERLELKLQRLKAYAHSRDTERFENLARTLLEHSPESALSQQIEDLWQTQTRPPTRRTVSGL